MERFLSRQSTRIAGVVERLRSLTISRDGALDQLFEGMDRFRASHASCTRTLRDLPPASPHVCANMPRNWRANERPLEYFRSSAISKDARAREILHPRWDYGGIGLYLLVRRIVPDVHGARRSLAQTPAPGARRAALYLSVLLLCRSGLRPDARPAANVVAADDPDVCEWPRMACAAIDRRRARLRTTRQRANPRRLYPTRPPSATACNLRLGAVADSLGARVNPWIGDGLFRGYYWSVRESEFATDVIFATSADLAGDPIPVCSIMPSNTSRPATCCAFSAGRYPDAFKARPTVHLVHRPRGHPYPPLAR